jgi:hypothetical protein
MSDLDRVVRCAIHPALGVARIGNAPVPDDPERWDQGFYIAPEIPGQAARPKGGFKTPDGKIKREAARFRVYGYDDQGNVVKEITAADADITWTVHVANRKTAWYQFQNAMDMQQYALVTTFRNAAVQGTQRRQLVIDPGPRSIEGTRRSGRQYRFDSGFVRFPDTSPISVYLGELRTDGDGRLLFLGGLGTSASVYNQPPTTFANNEGWYDDTSDGTVRATVTIDGKSFVADPAMVAVAPPNFGQGLHAVVTMWDVVHDLFRRQGWATSPKKPVFWEHIAPILSRMVDHQWVNEGFYFLFGAGSPSDLTEPGLLEKLADPGEESRGLREYYFNWFRPPLRPWDEGGPPGQLPKARPADIPPFYGDGFSEFRGTFLADLWVTPTQYEWLRLWAKGEFETGKPEKPHPKIEDYPLPEQPRLLDRSPLEDCLGGPFHPGIELTWTLRVPQMWQPADPNDPRSLPYRLRVLDGSPRDDYGAQLTGEVAIGSGGPTDGSGPGSLTRWMGVPWQTDEASCLAGYDLSTYLPLPSFWAARVPNEVLSHKAYKRVLDERLPLAQRLKHMSYRQFWLRDINVNNNERRRLMVTSWDKMGIVTEQKGPDDHEKAGLPARFWVETDRSKSFAVNDPTWHQVVRAERVEEAERRRKIAEGIEEEAAPRAELELVHAEVVPALPATAAVEPEEEIGHPLRRELDQHSL